MGRLRGPEDLPVAQRLPRGCTRILLARLRGSGRSQLSRAALAVSIAKSKRPLIHRAPSARRAMAVAERASATAARVSGARPACF